MGSMVNTRPGTSTMPVPGSDTWLTNGSSWKSKPMPWPPNSRTTEKPCAFAYAFTAAPTSPSSPHGSMAARPASMAFFVSSTRRCRSGDTAPMQNMRDESE